ncbi:MAG: class I SAM-dependent methyltransferase [Bdellovibrionota bacterium]
MDLSKVALQSRSLCPDSAEFKTKWNLTLNPSNLSKYDFFLNDESGFWQLRTRTGQQFEINFDQNKMDYQRKNVSKKNILAKAIGLKTKGLCVLDLTAGLAIDAVHLTQLGCKITSLERNPVLHFLLSQAQKKSSRAEIKNIDFLLADAGHFLLEQGQMIAEKFDVIYYDPMFPEKKKSALPRKEMQVFRQLVGEDADTKDVIDASLQTRVKRFVVKRPLRSTLEKKVDPNVSVITYKGNTVQYQAYLQGTKK